MSSYKEKFIREITPEDKKISISGSIINKEDNLVLIDDSTGVIAVNINTSLNVKTFVRVFGYLIRNNNDFQLQGQIIQDLGNVNRTLYNKVKSFLNQKE